MWNENLVLAINNGREANKKYLSTGSKAKMQCQQREQEVCRGRMRM
jgi:hypothetical protein